MKRFVLAAAAVVSLSLPAFAASNIPYITVNPAHLVLVVGQSGSVSAQLHNRITRFGPSTNSCYYSGTSNEVLKLVSTFSKQNGDVIGVNVVGQKPGACRIQFNGDGASTIVEVTVKPSPSPTPH